MAAFTTIFERFVAFRRIPLRVVIITALTSYLLQLGAILQGQPLYIIALFTVLPWIPIAFFEGLWKYEHYSYVAIFALITALQVGHLGEHAFQVSQLYVLNGVLECPFPQDNAANAQRAIDAGLRPANQPPTGIYASQLVHFDDAGQPVKGSDGREVSGPPACGVFGQLDFETIHFYWDTSVWIGALFLLLKFPRNGFLWLALSAASLHEMEHMFLYYIYVRETAHVFRYTHTLWATTVEGNIVTGHPVGRVVDLTTFYEAGGKQGLMGRHGLVESVFFNNSITFPFRPVLHFGYNSVVVIPTVIAFIWQARRVYNQYLARALPGLSEQQLVQATPQLERVRFAPGEVIVRQGDPADRFYIITRGQVEVLREEPGGQEVPITRLSAGQYFGEIGLLHGGKRIATCRAADNVEALALDRNTFSNLMDGSDVSKETLDRLVRQRVVQTQAIQAASGP